MVWDVSDKLHQDIETGNEDVPGPDVVVTVGPEIPNLVPHPGRLHPDRRREAGGPGQHVEQAGAVRGGNGQAPGPHKLPAVQQGQLVGVVHSDWGVGSLVVVGQALEAQLDPWAPWWRRQVVRVKPELFPSAVKEEAIRAPEVGKVALQAGSDVGPEKGGQVQV